MKNKIIVSCLIFICIFRLYKTSEKHLFWSNKQPVLTGNTIKKGIIMNLDDIKQIDLPDKFTKINFTNNNIDIFIKFINNHFDNTTNITLDHLNWHLDNALDNNLVFGIKCNNILYGVITGNLIYIDIDKKRYKTIYVDYLCIDKLYRNNNLSPILISFIIDYMKKHNCPLSLFKKDSSKHYFRHFYKNNYYFLNIKKYVKWKNYINEMSLNEHFGYLFNSIYLDKSINIKNIKEYTDNDNILSKLYDIYIKDSLKYKIYEFVDINKFKTKLLANNVIVLIFYKNNKLYGYIVLNKLYYPYFNDYGYNIYHFIIKSKYKKSIIDSLINYIEQNNINNINYIITSSNPNTNYIINYLKMAKCIKSYYYLYNYSISNINTDDILLNY